jgi:hypothetical protein
MIIEILTAATAGSTIVLGLAINASRAQVRGLGRELKPEQKKTKQKRGNKGAKIAQSVC